MNESQTEQAVATIDDIHGDRSNQSEFHEASSRANQQAPKAPGDASAEGAPATAPQGAVAADMRKDPQPARHRLPDERRAIVHHFSVGGHEGYVMVGLYEDGQPGEIFLRMAKAGSTIAGLMDSFGIAISMALQYGVPLKVLCDKFSHTRFEPSGWSTVQGDRLREVLDGLSLPLAGLEISPRHVPSQNGRRNHQRGPGARLPGGCVGRRCASLQGMWIHHDPERIVLSLRQLRLDERLLVGAKGRLNLTVVRKHVDQARER